MGKEQGLLSGFSNFDDYTANARQRFMDEEGNSIERAEVEVNLDDSCFSTTYGDKNALNEIDYQRRADTQFEDWVKRQLSKATGFFN